MNDTVHPHPRRHPIRPVSIRGRHATAANEEPSAPFALIATGDLCATAAVWEQWTITALAYPLYVAASTGAVALPAPRHREPAIACLCMPDAHDAKSLIDSCRNPIAESLTLGKNKKTVGDDSDAEAVLRQPSIALAASANDPQDLCMFTEVHR